MSWVSSFLRKTGLNKPGKFVAKAVSLPVRGVGRIARGKWEEGLKDIGGGAARLGAMAMPFAGGAVLGGLGSAAKAGYGAGQAVLGGGWGTAMKGAGAVKGLMGGGQRPLPDAYSQYAPQGNTGSSPASGSGMSSLDKWGLGLQAFGLGAQTYGQYQGGKSYDEEMGYRRQMEEEDRQRRMRAGERMSPFLERYMSGGGGGWSSALGG